MAYYARCPTLLTPSNVWISSLFLHLIAGGLTEGLSSVTIATGSDFNKGEAAVASTFAVAFEDAAAQYPAVYPNHSWIMRHDNFSGTCNESVPHLIEELGQLYDQSLARNNQLTVIYAPVCPDMFMQIADFARGSTYDDERLENRRRFPTAVSFARTSGAPYGALFLALMDKFRWHHIALLIDTMVNSTPTYVGRNRGQCSFIQSALRARKFPFVEVVFDARFNKSIEDGLLSARRFSRVILLCCLIVPLKAVLRKAHELGMVDGRYVFMLVYASRVRNEPYLKKDDFKEQVIKESAKSLIVIRSTQFPFAAFQSQLIRMEEKRSSLYHITVDPENQCDEYNFACYEAVQAVSEMVNRSCDLSRSSACSSGKYLAQQLLNRTFHTSLRPLSITPTGTRTLTVEAQMFDNDTETFTNVMSLNSIERILREERTVPWLLGTAPVDRLPCWPNNDDCYRERHSLLYSLLVILGFALVGWIFGRFIWLQWVFYTGNYTVAWWYISSEKMDFNFKKTTLGRISRLA